jgi:type I restriction enzyme S subunit
MKVKLRDILTPVSRAEPVESEKKYRILGVKWYAKGAWVKDEKYGADIKANSAYSVQEGDLIYNRLFAWKGSFAVISKDLDGSYVSNEFPALRCNEEMAYLDYIFLFLSQYDVWTAIDKLSTGVASISRKRLKVQELLNLKVLLPPKNIQQKIINKYSQIDSFYSQLIKLQDKNAVFVKKLRQAILQLAVQGKLAPQDSNDEPASELLKRIKAEKEKLIAEGKIKKQKPLPPITEDEIPYELPQGWMWVRLRNVSHIILGQSPPSTTYNTYGEGLPFYQGKVDYGKIFPTPTKWCTSPQKVAEAGDVLISVRAPVGPTNICEERSCIGRGLAAIRGGDNLDTFYILYTLRAFEHEISGQGFGSTFTAITGNHLNNFLFPFPPLAEQNRIVAKVDQLMHLCDELETQLNQSQKDSEMLMQAVLQEAFAIKQA